MIINLINLKATIGEKVGIRGSGKGIWAQANNLGKDQLHQPRIE